MIIICSEANNNTHGYQKNTVRQSTKAKKVLHIISVGYIILYKDNGQLFQLS